MVGSMAIRAELTDRAKADLERIHDELTRLGDDDLNRGALEEREAELTRLLDDLEHGVPSPSVLAGTAQLRARRVA